MMGSLVKPPKQLPKKAATQRGLFHFKCSARITRESLFASFPRCGFFVAAISGNIQPVHCFYPLSQRTSKLRTQFCAEDPADIHEIADFSPCFGTWRAGELFNS